MVEQCELTLSYLQALLSHTEEEAGESAREEKMECVELRAVLDTVSGEYCWAGLLLTSAPAPTPPMPGLPPAQRTLNEGLFFQFKNN